MGGDMAEDVEGNEPLRFEIVNPHQPLSDAALEALARLLLELVDDIDRFALSEWPDDDAARHTRSMPFSPYGPT